jgi:RNA polymerase sigma factor (sigma-70 family)
MSLKNLSDSELVSLYIAENDNAFKVLLNRYKSKVYSTIYFIVKDRELSEDLTQDTFFKVIDVLKSGKYNEKGKFKPYIMRVAHNLAVDYYRKNKPFEFVRDNENFDLFSTLPLVRNTTEEIIDKKENHHILRNMIKELPFEQKQVLLMRHFAGMSFQEISEMTGVLKNTCLGRMRYAVLNLRKKLEQNDAYEKNIYR